METSNHLKNGALPKSQMSRKQKQMKNTILIFSIFLSVHVSHAQTTKPAKKITPSAKKIEPKFGALAIDRSNGFYYGWSYDYATQAEADLKAVEECKKKGGNCSVVLSYSGTGCAAYRTINGTVGTAFGWGLAKTKEEADAIALKECLKRSNGVNPTNFVWSCNAANTVALKEIYNASQEIDVPVKIGNQLWSNKNLDVSAFRNGDKIIESKNDAEWNNAQEKGLPTWRYLEDKKENGLKYGKLYNFYAVTDARGLAPVGYKVATKQDWQTLADYINDPSLAGAKLKSKTGWKELNGTDDYGFNALPAGNVGMRGGFYGIGGAACFWTSTKSDDEYSWGITIYGHRQQLEIQRNDKFSGRYIRCIKQ
jgi:uncharacterized protein (TIGR02145 family)